MRNSNYTPRLSIELSESQAIALQKIFPYGLKKPYFSNLVDWTINWGTTRGMTFLSAIALGQKDPEGEIIAYLLRDYIKDNAIDTSFIDKLNKLWNILVAKYENPFSLNIESNKKHLDILINHLMEGEH